MRWISGRFGYAVGETVAGNAGVMVEAHEVNVEVGSMRVDVRKSGVENMRLDSEDKERSMHCGRSQ